MGKRLVQLLEVIVIRGWEPKINVTDVDQHAAGRLSPISQFESYSEPVFGEVSQRFAEFFAVHELPGYDEHMGLVQFRFVDVINILGKLCSGGIDAPID